MNPDQQRLLSRAKLTMLRRLPYYGAYCMGMDHEERYDIPTAATKGRRFLINPHWMLGGETYQGITHPLRPVDEVIFIEAHEVLHNSLKHMLRIGWRDPRLANVAADHCVNLLLLEEKIGAFPTPWPEEAETWQVLADPRFTNMSFEQVYDILEREWDQQGRPKRFRSGGLTIDLRHHSIGEVEPVRELTDAEQAALSRALDSLVSASAAAAKSHGTLPASIERLIKTALRPKVDWRERLRFFVGKTMPGEYSWARPNRRYIGSLDLYLPHLGKSGVGQIAFGFDTSGSMRYSGARSEGAQLFAECKAIYQETNPELMHVFYCDAKVQGHEVFLPGDDPEMARIKPRGGGGTNFKPLFNLIEKQQLPLQCLVFGTDGYATYPDKPPPFPVLWVLTTQATPPWGEVVRMER